MKKKIMTDEKIVQDGPSSMKIFMNALSISRYFYGITFLGYLFGYIMRGVGITMIIPLTKGLIEKNYSFIFNNKIIHLFVQYFPFLKTMTDIQIFFFFSFAIVILTITSLGINYLISLYIWHQKKDYSLRSTTFILEKYMSLGMGFFIQYKSSMLRAKLEAIPRQSDALISTTQSFIQLIFEMTMIFIILFSVSPYLALLACVFFSITGSVFNFIKSTINKFAIEENESSIQYDAKIQDILGRQMLIFSTHNQKKEQDDFVQAYNVMNDKRYRMQRLESLLNPCFLMFQIICIIIVGLLLGKTVFFSQVTSVSAAVVFLALFRQGMIKIQSFGMMFIQRRNSWKILGKLMEDIMSLKPPVKSGPKKFISLKKSISCKNLIFSYEKTIVLKNISFNIPASKITVITGENGSGKSTLLSLILRFYDCPEGSLLLDGEKIHTFDIVSWRSKIAYVAQDVILFHGTLEENLTYGFARKISNKRLFDVIEKVGLTDFVQSLPEGLETNIGDGGLKFSGGQRQRIAIARALLCNPQIIIFDEATKSIDTKTDEMIMQMLVNEFQNTTRIVVTHNPLHQKMADQIITLEREALVKNV